MTKLLNLNQVSDDLLAAIPKLEPGELKTFQCLWGIKVHDAEQSDKFKLEFGKRRFNLKDKIYDPYQKKTIDIGIPDQIVNGQATEFKKFAPGESEGKFGGRFSLSGDNPDEVEIFEFLMLSTWVKNNKHRTSKEPALLELMGVIEDANTHQVIKPPKLVDTSAYKSLVAAPIVPESIANTLIDEKAKAAKPEDTKQAVKNKPGRKKTEVQEPVAV